MSNTVYSIVPAIGIARVGNAPTAFYIGPETEGTLPTLPTAAPSGSGISATTRAGCAGRRRASA